jgi:hypothetical protein
MSPTERVSRVEAKRSKEVSNHIWLDQGSLENWSTDVASRELAYTKNKPKQCQHMVAVCAKVKLTLSDHEVKT